MAEPPNIQRSMNMLVTEQRKLNERRKDLFKTLRYSWIYPCFGEIISIIALQMCKKCLCLNVCFIIWNLFNILLSFKWRKGFSNWMFDNGHKTSDWFKEEKIGFLGFQLNEERSLIDKLFHFNFVCFSCNLNILWYKSCWVEPQTSGHLKS